MENIRVVVICHGNMCNWYIYVANIGKSSDWEIRIINDKHKCTKSFHPRLVRPKYLAKKYLEDFKSNRRVEVREFIKKVHRDFM